MKSAKPYIEKNKQRFLDELIELLKIPSISADQAYKEEVIKAAEAVKVQLEKAGCDNVEVCETTGNPIVYGEKIIDKNLPTILVYGHYDVQPQIHWLDGLIHLLSRLSRKQNFTPMALFLPVVVPTTKARCTCT